MILQKLNEIREELVLAQALYQTELEEAPEGKLLCSKSSDGVRYYRGTKAADGSYKRKGVGRDPQLMAELARKEYVTKALPLIERNIAVLDRAIAGYKPFSPEDVAQTLSSTYRGLPVEMFHRQIADIVAFGLDASDAERIASHAAWGLEPYETDDYRPEGRIIVTSQGVRVRSKAEALIAEKLHEYLIPFRYEQRLDLGDGMVVHPDFTFEGAGGEEFYLEYCGMMDDEKYVAAHKRKVAMYEDAGIVPWKNVIYLYGQGNEMDMRRVDSLIRTQIIPWL